MRRGAAVGIALLAVVGSVAAAPVAQVWVPVPVPGVGGGEAERVVPITTLPPPVRAALQQETGRDLEIGYYYRYYFLFRSGFDLWTWGGRWVLFAGNEYWPLTSAQLTELLGAESAAALRPPLRYTFPPGLLILLAGAIGLALLVWRMEAGNRRVRRLADDPRFRQGFDVYTQALAGQDEPPVEVRRQALQDAIAWLQQAHGMPAAEAEAGLRALVKEFDKARSYELRHLAINLEQGQLYEGAIRHFQQAADLQAEWNAEDHAFLLSCIDRVKKKQARK